MCPVIESLSPFSSLYVSKGMVGTDSSAIAEEDSPKYAKKETWLDP